MNDLEITFLLISKIITIIGIVNELWVMYAIGWFVFMVLLVRLFLEEPSSSKEIKKEKQ